MFALRAKRGELLIRRGTGDRTPLRFPADGTSVPTSVDVTISSAQLLALFATPQPIVAAPGAGFANIFEGIGIHKPAGTAYGGIAAGEDLSVKYTDAAGLEQCQVETTGFLDQATAQFRYGKAHTAASLISSITPVANAALVLQILTGEITTGDSPLYCRVFYRGVPTALIIA